MTKRCYVADCDRSAGWIYHDEEYGDTDSCAEHAFYADWEERQAEFDATLARPAFTPTPPPPAGTRRWCAYCWEVIGDVADPFSFAEAGALWDAHRPTCRERASIPT